MNFAILQDTEEKGSISNTEQEKKKRVPVLAAMPAREGRPLEHSTAQERLPTIKPAFFKFSVQGRIDTSISVLVTAAIQAASVSISKSKHVREV